MTLRKKWLFADKNAREILGDDPLAHFKDPVLIKGNAVREVWKCGEFFFKFDKRRNHSFRKEFCRATALHKRGIPVVRYSPIAATVVQLSTMQPTSMGSLPTGTILPVV